MFGVGCRCGWRYGSGRTGTSVRVIIAALGRVLRARGDDFIHFQTVLMIPVQAAQGTRQNNFGHVSVHDFVQEDLHTVFGIHKVHAVGAQEGFYACSYTHTHVFVGAHSNCNGAVTLVSQREGRFGQIVVGGGVVALAQVAVFSGNGGSESEEAFFAHDVVRQERSETRCFYVKDTVVFRRIFIVN